MIAAVAALVPVLGLFTAQPAGADAEQRVVKQLTFSYRSQPLTCTVVGENSTQYNDQALNLTIYFATELVDEEHRCYQALGRVSVALLWRQPGVAVEQSVSTDSESPQIRAQINLEGAESAFTIHRITFTCDAPQGCALDFGVPVRFQPK